MRIDSEAIFALAQSLTMFMGRKKREKVNGILVAVARLGDEYDEFKAFLKRMDTSPIPRPTTAEMAMLNRVHAMLGTIGALNHSS